MHNHVSSLGLWLTEKLENPMDLHKSIAFFHLRVWTQSDPVTRNIFRWPWGCCCCCCLFAHLHQKMEGVMEMMPTVLNIQKELEILMLAICIRAGWSLDHHKINMVLYLKPPPKCHLHFSAPSSTGQSHQCGFQSPRRPCSYLYLLPFLRFPYLWKHCRFHFRSLIIVNFFVIWIITIANFNFTKKRCSSYNTNFHTCQLKDFQNLLLPTILILKCWEW